jgi:hypothetical protein
METGNSPILMFKILILICSVNLTPAECQVNNALDVIDGPEASSEALCGMYGQAYIADTALGARPHENEYVKVLCTRSSIGKTVG